MKRRALFAFVAVAASAACGTPNDEEVGSAGGGDAAPSDSLAWTHSAVPPFDQSDFFDFDLIAYRPTTTDDAAFTAYVPNVAAGDELRIQVSGYPNPRYADPGISCDLMLHVTQEDGDEEPVSSGGRMLFVNDADPSARMDFGGTHVARQGGQVRVRLLGRVTVANRFCGFGGDASLTVEHIKPMRN